MPASLVLLLPRRAVLAGPERLPALERILARGVRLPLDAARGHPWLEHLIDLPRRPWPWAAITRAADAGDAGQGVWLRADPAHVRADIAGARLLAVGDLGLAAQESAALQRTLAPLFGDLGFECSAPRPERWYLRLPPGAEMPHFSPPWQALGEDVRAHLPQGGPAARWQRVMNECQVVLHDHPVNQARAAAGRMTANSLWFWGGGSAPTRVSARIDAVASEDPLLSALAAAAGVPVSRSATAGPARQLLDLRALRDPRALDAAWIEPAWRALRLGELATLEALFADGEAFRVGRAAAFAAWRRPRPLAS
ncbi:MAG: phosphoglycerate mutase [Xanthomonadaceae bacterium]|jgi:hypothetical protein|nr:phosphoglycerate mutase [Xanthomonadaceae bacterium]